MYKFVTIAALAALAIAAPLPGGEAPEPQSEGQQGQEPQFNAIQYTATFDDLKPLTENAALQATGPYDGLDFEGIDTVELGVGGTVVAGVIPQSFPNAGAYGATTELTQGEPQITSDYPGTVTIFFDFQEFYFGCVAGTVEAVASAPVSCNVTVTGYSESNVVGRQSFEFSPGLVLTAPMTKAVLDSGFQKVDYVTFDSTYEVSAAGATLLDNLSYIAYSLKNETEGQGEQWSS